MPTSIASIIDRIERSQLVARSPLQGCTEEQLVQLERKFSLRLPQAYREFMLAMGRSAGDFLVGSDYSIRSVEGFRTGLEAMVEECNAQATIPASDFVFFSHQGYTYLYFDTAMGDDPPIWMWTDTAKNAEEIASCFSDWLNFAALDEIGPQSDR